MSENESYRADELLQRSDPVYIAAKKPESKAKTKPEPKPVERQIIQPNITVNVPDEAIKVEVLPATAVKKTIFVNRDERGEIVGMTIE